MALQADRHAIILATSRDGFWLFDTNGKLLEVSDVYCQMSGYTREEVLKLHIADVEAIEKRRGIRLVFLNTNRAVMPRLYTR